MSIIEELELIDKAIVAIYSGAQSFRIGSREATRADLGQLLRRKNELQSQLNDFTGRNTMIGTFIPR